MIFIMFREFCLSHNALLQKPTFYGIIHNEKKSSGVHLMFYKMIKRKCDEWLASDKCTVKNLIDYNTDDRRGLL